MNLDLAIRLTPVLLAFNLCCASKLSIPPVKPSAESAFSRLDPLPGAVGTCQTTFNPGEDIPVRFWYPLDRDRKSAKTLVSLKGFIHKEVAEAREEHLAEVSDYIRQRDGAAPADAREALRTYLVQSMRTRALDESKSAHPAMAQGRFPMVVLAHGAGGSSVDAYCSIAESLAGHGFIVAAIENPERGSKADNLKDWQRRIFTVIAGLKEGDGIAPALHGWIGSHINFERIGILGHSRGGVAAMQALANPAHPGVLKAGGNIDGSPDEAELESLATSRPFLYVDLSKARQGQSIPARLVERNNRLPGGASELLEVVKTQPRFRQVGHCSCMDSPLLMASAAAVLPSMRGTLSEGFGDLSSEEGRAIHSTEFHNYLNRQLAGFFTRHL